MRKAAYLLALTISLAVSILAGSTFTVRAELLAQQPTLSIATVTGTPLGPFITVNPDNDQINVRNGPGTEYDKIGVLISGEVAPALGKSAAGLWIQISYPGVPGGVAWVYSPLVTVSGGDDLPVVPPPPTPAPLQTATIDPTLAAQFQVEVPPTRLPTYTAPPPLAIPTFTNPDPGSGFGGWPPVGFFISLFGAVGLIGTLFSIARRR